VNCPACDQSLHELDPACPQCGFSLAQADTTFGQPPLIIAPITDPEHLLSTGAKRRLSGQIRAFGRRFPQLQLSLALLPKPPSIAEKPYLFWLFNRSTTHTAMEKGGNNRQILLWIDPSARTAHATFGYGLEPLIAPETHLTPCLLAGKAPLEAGQIAAAAAAIIAKFTEHFEALAAQLPLTYGWAPEAQWQSMDAEQTLLTLHPETQHSLSY